MGELSHIDENGEISMVDVGYKPPVYREATACGAIFLKDDTIHLIEEHNITKGNVLTTAKIAGIQATKQTGQMIPLCHQIHLNKVDMIFKQEEGKITITATVTCNDRTGPEMEALSAVTIAALTIYDMCKAVDKEMVIGEIRVCHKSKTSA
jgi:cyclic pyranopterin phosphate synthase